MCPPVALPQSVIPWESGRFEPGLALFLWSLHVISLILMRPHGPPVMLLWRKRGIPCSLWGCGGGGWTSVTQSLHPTPSFQPGLSGASNVLFSRFTGSHSSEEIQQPVNHQSVESALRLHNGACVYHHAWSMRTLSDCFTEDVDNAAPEY